MAEILPFRDFKIPARFESQFFSVDDSKSQRFMQEDLARSGLSPDDLLSYVHSGTRVVEGCTASYVIPYRDAKGKTITDKDGFPIMFRTRMQLPDFSREQRYTQPSGEMLAKLGLPPYIPYIHWKTLELPGEELICAEGEKKACSIIKFLGLPTFGIGGCELWRNPDGSGGIHPWIKDVIRARGATRVTIVPDGDVLRYDICTAYGNFARALENEGILVKILHPDGKIDDLLVGWGDKAVEGWSGIRSLSIDDLVQSPAALIKKYGLAFKADSKNKPIVHQHLSNIIRLMEEHDAFPKIWRNLDNNTTMVGDFPARPDYTEVDLCGYLQHNLGFDKISHRLVYTAIQALSKKNEKSPFLDYVKNQIWDGKQRLSTWLTRLWGVEDSGYVREVSAKWLISACARMNKPGTKLDWMMIVIGPQETGKTTMPSILFKGCNKTLYGETNDKDLHMLLHSSLCAGFDELDTFNRREASTLKAMVTRNEDAFRPPYGASIEIFPRRFTLYGCGNKHDFLQSDPSGYRRYAIIEVSRLLDFRGMEAERDQLWAEAWAVYQTGQEDYWRIQGASEIAKQYAVADPIEDDIETFLRKKITEKIAPGKDGEPVHFTMKELLIHLQMEKEHTGSSRIKDIAALLHAKGVVKPIKATRHPDTKAVGRWYIWDPSSLPPIT